jgi:hemoglobin/transferrin/lactoferrin receptor protein
MMKKRIAILIALLVLPLSLVYAQTATLEGRVVSQASGDPLSGVNLMLFQKDQLSRAYRSTITGMDGDYTLQDVPPGEYVLSASHIGYERQSRSFVLAGSYREINLELKEQYIDLGEVVVSSLHQQKQVKQVSMPMEVMDEGEMEHLAAFSPSEALASEPGISMQNDGVWATSVNIRGMSEQRIVTLVDGNRIETATDLAAGLSMIDMSDLERVEVIKGAASSIYGTGAMGGVVNFITKSGHFSSKPYTNGVLSSSFQSVNDMLFRKLALSTGNSFGYIRVSGMMRNANDIQTPRGVLENSQFQDNSITLDAGLRPLENHQMEVQYHRFYAEDVGIPGGAPFPGPAEATYPEEKRTLYSASYQITDISPALTNISAKYYHQYIFRDVLMRPNTPPQQVQNFRITPQKITPQGKHNTDGIKLQSNWLFGEGHDVTAGIDLWQRSLQTSREKYIQRERLNEQDQPVDTIQMIRGEVPIPESTFGSAGLFLQDRFSMLDGDLEVTIGGRYDLIRVHNEQALDPFFLTIDGNKNTAPPGQRITFPEQTVYNRSWSADLGLLYGVGENVDLTLTLGRSFRSPSLEERYKYIDLGNKVRIGDPDLEPEQGYQIDGGVRIWEPGINLRLNGFMNRFSDMIVEQPGQYVYSYSESTQKDTLPALINSNVDETILYGVDMKLDLHLMQNLVFHSTLSYVRGRDIRNDQNLPLIPPFNGIAGLKYHFPGSLTVDIFSEWAARQNKTAEGETATPGYALLSLRTYTAPVNLNFARVRFTAGVENIFDKAYQNHLSTNRGAIQIEPGRNFYIKMQLHF